MRTLVILLLAGCTAPLPMADPPDAGPGERVRLPLPDLAQPGDGGLVADLARAQDLAQAPDLVQLPDLAEAPDLLACSPLGAFCSAPCCTGACGINALGGASCCLHLGNPCATDADCCADTGAGAPTHCYPSGQGGRCCYVSAGQTICN